MAQDEFREFKVTMENPNKTSPKPLVVKIDGMGVTVERQVILGAAPIIASPAPRAGDDDE